MSTETAPHTPSTDKREAILDAALALFAERGFYGTAVPLVAERAGVGAGTIYRYFDSKEALVNVLYQRWKTEISRLLFEDFDFQRPVREQVRTYWRRMVRFAIDHRDAIQFMELHHHGPYLDDVSHAVECQVLTMSRAYFDDTRQRQITRDVPSMVIIAVVHGAFSALLRAHWDGQLELTEEIIDQTERCVWEAIRA